MHFSSLTDEPMSSTEDLWDTGEPSNFGGVQHYVVLKPDTKKFDDVGYDEVHKFICEP